MNLGSAFRSLLSLAGLCTVISSASAASLVHSYNLNGSFADSLGGPAMVGTGGSLGGTGYTFGANQGPNLSNALTSFTGNYSIEMLFSISENNDWRKLIDFEDLSSDYGLYNLTGSLSFFPVNNGPSVIGTNTLVHVVATRDSSSELFTGYVNGVAQFSFEDIGGFATFTGTDNIIHFLRDDVETDGDESSAGFLDQVRIYDGALSSTKVIELYQKAGVGVPDSLGNSWLLSIAAVISYRLRRKS